MNLWTSKSIKKLDLTIVSSFKVGITDYFNSCYNTKGGLDRVPTLAGLSHYLGLSSKEEFKRFDNVSEDHAKLVGQVMLTLEDIMIEYLVKGKVTNAKYVLDDLGFGEGGTVETNIEIEL